MAEYGIMVDMGKIKGNSKVPSYTDQLLGLSCSFSSNASRTTVGAKGTAKWRTSVNQSAVTLELMGGKWTAEILQALYAVTNLGDVTITQLGQAVDKAAKAEPTPIQSIKLTKAMVTDVQQMWTSFDGPRTITVTLEFEKILLTVGAKDPKVADYTLRNIT